MKALVAGDDGAVTVDAFEWSSANSERDRRKAADRLLAHVRAIEATGEPYSLVGHSHGGSVIAKMLVNAASKNQTLPNLRRWITVGTPFVEMRKEQFLFSRLPLLLKAVYVASLMLMFMFLVATFADVIDGKSPFATRESTTMVSAVAHVDGVAIRAFLCFGGLASKSCIVLLSPDSHSARTQSLCAKMAATRA